jgi:predicted nucleic acid-binding protein
MIYLDSGIVIRLIEGLPSVRAPIEARLSEIPVEERLLITSRLARLECRCKPLREKQSELLALYEAFFQVPEIRLAEIDAAVIETATELRADHGWKTPDAIHAATALLHNVVEFWTADEGFHGWQEIQVRMFSAI